MPRKSKSQNAFINKTFRYIMTNSVMIEYNDNIVDNKYKKVVSFINNYLTEIRNIITIHLTTNNDIFSFEDSLTNFIVNKWEVC